MNNKLLFLSIILLSVVFSSELTGNTPLRNVNFNTNNLTLEFILPEYNIQSQNNYTYIDCPQLKREEMEGKIDLPYYSFLIGVPPNGNLHYSIISTETDSYELLYPVAPYPVFIEDPQKGTYTPVYHIDKNLYETEQSQKILEVSEPYQWRQQTVVRIVLHPFTVENNKLKIIDTIKLSFSFAGDKSPRPFSDYNFENIFQNTIVNFDVAKNWSLESKLSRQDNPFSHADRWFKIPITKTGICKITKQKLSQTGIDVDNLDPNEIRVFNGGGFSQNRSIYSSLYPFEEIPVFVTDDGSEFSIYFYVRAPEGFALNENYNQYFNPYTSSNIYWLTFNHDQKKRTSNEYPYQAISSQRSKNDTLATYLYSEHFEQEKLRSDPESIVWYWQSFQGSSFTKYFEFSVTELNTEAEQQITINFNYRPNVNTLITYVNGEQLDNGVWNSTRVTYSGNFMRNGSNSLEVTLTNSSSTVLYLDYYEITYLKNLKMESNFVELTLPEPNTEYSVEVSNVANNELQIFKIIDFNHAEKITNFSYDSSNLSFEAISDEDDTKFCIVNSGGYILPGTIEEKFKPLVYFNGTEIYSYLRDDSTLANTEAIIITPDSPEIFWEKSKELADIHIQNDDINVLVVNVNDIYDEFSWGLPDVVALRYFLNYGYDYYAHIPIKKLAYVVLVGDGTNDFRGYETGASKKNKILPFINGTIVSDDYFVYFTNKINPSLMIGRFPGYLDAQIEIMLDKTINYISEPNFGYWRNRVVLSADDFLKHGSSTEIGHTTHAENCGRKIESNVELLKNYGITYPLDEFQNRPRANEDLIKMLNDGVAIFYYIGHGGYDVLGDEEYFRASRDINRLTNGDKLNFFVAASCDIGLFDSNTIESMAERILYTKDRGSVAVFASARKGGYGPCSDMINFAVNGTSENISIGEAVLMSKSVGASKAYEKYLLFGDPMLRTALPPLQGSITIPEVLADSLKARQTAELQGVIDTLRYQFDEIYNVVYDTDYSIEYPYDYRNPNTGQWEIRYLPINEKGKAIFKGPVSTKGNTFDLGFIVPDDVFGGQDGHVLSYAESSTQERDIAIRYNKRNDVDDHELIINGYAESENDGPPQITMWLDYDTFKNGDYVSSSPLIHIDIVDSNGVNITNYPGHRILLTLDNEDEYNITEFFVYNLDSYIKGSIDYQLESISAGVHTLWLEVFDNLNEVAFEEVEFKVKKPSDVSVRTVLNYPNPMNDHTYFTFFIDNNATADIEIYTIAGRKIKTIRDNQIVVGYNQVFWDGRDDDGDIPSNGVYFYKLVVNGKRIDDVYKLIISHK